MQFIREIIKSFLLKRNCILSRPPGQFSVDDWKYRQLKSRGAEIRAAVDGGAATGAWSKLLRSVYPDVRVLCIEPRKSAFQALREWSDTTLGIETADVLLGERDAQVMFNDSSDQSSVLNMTGNQQFGQQSESRMLTLDRLIQEKRFPQPDLIKLDLQGYELQALKGACESLKKCTFIELEISLFEFQEKQPLFGEVIASMDTLGFRLYDVLGLWHRPLDGALGQGDFLFVANGSPLVQSNRWA